MSLKTHSQMTTADIITNLENIRTVHDSNDIVSYLLTRLINQLTMAQVVSPEPVFSRETIMNVLLSRDPKDQN